MKDLVDSAPQLDLATGLYGEKDAGDHPMNEYKLQLSATKEISWEKHTPHVSVCVSVSDLRLLISSISAKYQPYDALRQRFWRQYLTRYDTDDTNTMSHLELTSMLDSLGSTITRSTVSAFFTRFGKRPHHDDITMIKQSSV